MSTKLRETIVLTATYYGKEISEPLLEMYFEDLADLDPEKCCTAYRDYRRNPKNKTFPLPAQIREVVCPEDYISPEAKAAEVAARIVSAVSKFGYTNPREAQAFIGEEGWSAVSRFGGWMYLCENLGVNLQLGTFQAQIRNVLEASFKYGTSAIEQAVGALPESTVRNGGDLIQLGESVQKLITDNPNDAA